VGTPWYLTAGDHDVNPAKFEPQSTDRSNEKRFQELCVGIGLPMEERLYYSVDFQGYHLVFLYSLENLHTDPRWGSIFLNGISDEQLKWLQSDLEQHRDTKGTIVITHHPHWYSWSNWFPVHKVLRAYSVIAVIGGHFHYDQDDGVIDGINYMVVGATGGGIKDADVESGGSYQYALLTLEGQNLSSYELREVFSDSLLERTSRRSMDRIQAISASMSNAYRDENLIMQDGMILSIDGNGHETIKTLIDIESIQNPIDLPVELSIYPVDSKLIAPRWVGSKAGKNGAYSIILEPGERCGWANYSNSGQWITPDAIWEADIVKDALKMAESPAIGVKLKMEYVDTRPRWISSQINFHVKSAKNQSENFLYK
ncbi:metallophosphoesterase, partial [bacterium]|nr:metallophosphoesterase [bacterium]